MSIAQAQAMKKARLDIEELQRQVAALTARVDAVESGAIVSRETIDSANIAVPPKKRGRPPKA
jgi:hypothetical protein